MDTLKRKVVDRKNLPVYFPVQLTIIAYLLLDKFNASGLVWGIVGTLFVILWFGVIITWANQESFDIFKQETGIK